MPSSRLYCLACAAELAALGCVTACGLIAGVEDGTLDPNAASSSSPESSATTASATGTASSGSASSSGAGGGPCGCDYAAVVKDDSPIAYWRLGEPELAPMAKDEIGMHPGSYTSGATRGAAGALACDTDTAVAFKPNGTVVVPDTSDLDFTRDAGAGSDSYALEAWINIPNVDGGGGTVCSKATYLPPDAGESSHYSGYLLATNTDPFRVVFIRGNGLTGGVTQLNADTPTDQWVHVVAQYNGSQKFLYVNGMAPTTEDDSTAEPDLDVDFIIGDSNWGNFTGLIDEVAVYDHTLAPARIEAHMKACAAR